MKGREIEKSGFVGVKDLFVDLAPPKPKPRRFVCISQTLRQPQAEFAEFWELEPHDRAIEPRSEAFAAVFFFFFFIRWFPRMVFVVWEAPVKVCTHETKTCFWRKLL